MKKIIIIMTTIFTVLFVIFLCYKIINKFNNTSIQPLNNSKITLDSKKNDIKISSDGLFKYSVKNQSIVGLNISESTDFIYYDNTYFDIYNYDQKKLTIPSKIDDVKILKISSFNIGGVEEIIVEEGIEEISDYCFVGATSLKSIKLPKSIKIGKNIFGNRKLEIIYY